MQQLDLPGLENVAAFVKHDAEKDRFDLLDPEFIRGVAQVLTHGARKYQDDNWKLCEEPMKRYGGASQRHLNAVLRGEEIDPDSGLPHTLLLGCNAMFLEWFRRAGKL